MFLLLGLAILLHRHFEYYLGTECFRGKFKFACKELMNPFDCGYVCGGGCGGVFVYCPENQRGTQAAPENTPIDSLQRSEVCKCWVCWSSRQHLWIAVNDVTFHTYHVYKKNLSFSTEQYNSTAKVGAGAQDYILIW